MLLDVPGRPLEIVRGPTAEVLELRFRQRAAEFSRKSLLAGDSAAGCLSGCHTATNPRRPLSRVHLLLLRSQASRGGERAPYLHAGAEHLWLRALWSRLSLRRSGDNPTEPPRNRESTTEAGEGHRLIRLREPPDRMRNILRVNPQEVQGPQARTQIDHRRAPLVGRPVAHLLLMLRALNVCRHARSKLALRPAGRRKSTSPCMSARRRMGRRRALLAPPRRRV